MTPTDGPASRLARRLPAALRAGRTAFLVAVLATALFASPDVAAESDFGHRHPADAPAHVHAIGGVLSALPVASAPTPGAVLATLLLFLIPVLAVFCRRPVLQPAPPRAPPVGLS